MKQVLIILLALATLACQHTEESEKTNVVFILADDLGWNQVGYHGSEYYETPNIDGIAAEGLSFSNAYSANPVCSPTRASIMTGKNPARLHLTNYIPGSPYPYARLTTPEISPGLPLDEYTLAELFRDHGYATGHFGKWHLNADKNYEPGRPKDPASQGFDQVFTSVKPAPDADPSDDAHHAVEITEHALDFIRKHQDQPFFAYVTHHVVHRPIMEKPALVSKYEAKAGNDDPVNNPIMGAMIETMDDGIGRILDLLKELGLEDNTIVVFYSDNGGFEQLQDQAPFRGGKAMVFEGGIRVPLAVRWPGITEAGSTSDALVISDDFFPTFAEILGAEVPAGLDGSSMHGLWKGEEAREEKTLYFHYPHYHHQGYMPAGAIREGDYKLIEWYEGAVAGEGKACELFNLADDPGEEEDLSEAMPELVNDLLTKLRAWKAETGAQVMEVNENYDPEKADWKEQENKDAYH